MSKIDIAIAGSIVKDVFIDEHDRHVSTTDGGACFIARVAKGLLGESVNIHSYGKISEDLPVEEITRKIKLFPQSTEDGNRDNRSRKIFRHLNQPKTALPECIVSPLSPHPTIAHNDEKKRYDFVIIEDSCRSNYDQKGVINEIVNKLESVIENSSHDSIPRVVVKLKRSIRENNILLEALEENYSKKSIIIIEADLLRLEGLSISKDISWERTAQDFLMEWYNNSGMKCLRSFSHVIVQFGITGAIYIYKSDSANVVKSISSRVHQLYFDPIAPRTGVFRDPDYDGDVIGSQTFFSLSIVKEIINLMSRQLGDETSIMNAIGVGIKKGIRRCQINYTEGYGGEINNIKSCLEDPCGKCKPNAFVDIDIETLKIANGRVPIGILSWSLLNQTSEYQLLDIARDIVIDGIDKVLNNPAPNRDRILWVPVVRFSDLTVIDRRELEGYRTIYRLMAKAIISEPDTPLSIAVFGPPGSGKSFVVRQLAESIPTEIDVREINLSQLESFEELKEKIEGIKKDDYWIESTDRDRQLLVFVDEFDSNLKEQELGWLKYFLAYMEDWYRTPEWKSSPRKNGNSPGNIIFVFAGGTSRNYLDFTREDTSLNEQM